jgi:hypothetical protein
MLEGLRARGRRIAAARVERIVALAEAVAREELPGDIFVEKTGDGLVISGKGLGIRVILDVRLRGLGALLKAVAR